MAPFLELEHLIDALKGFSRPSAEGRQALVNIVCVGTRVNDDKRAVVEALCVRTTKIDDPPVQINVTIDKNTKKIEEKIQQISCSCPAGASKQHVCKHAFATLLFLSRNEESDIEKFTCTDLEQVWGTLKEQSLAKFDPSPLNEFCHVQKPPTPYKRPILEVTAEMEKKFRALFLADQPESEAAIFLSCVRAPPLRPQDAPSELEENTNSLREAMMMAIEHPNYLVQRASELSATLLSECSAEEQKFYNENVAVTTTEAINMNVDTVGQDNDLWMMFRRNRITGSVCYPLYTYSKNKKPNWGKKLASLHSDYHNDDMEDGLIYEGDGRDSYLKAHPNAQVIVTGIFVHPLVPWLGYSADGLVFENGAPSKLLEIKVPVKGNKFPPLTVVHELSYLEKDTGHLKHKHKYYGQVQLGMALYNLSACHFLNYCICVDNIATDTVMFDGTWVLDLLERLATVYFKIMLPYLCKNAE